MSVPWVTYLDLAIAPTHKVITLDGKHLIQLLLVPATKDKILSYLGMAGFLYSWIPSFSLFTYPLYEVALTQTPPCAHTKPFYKLQQAHLQALDLHLPNLTHPSLSVTEKKGYALRVLDHELDDLCACCIFIKDKQNNRGHTIQRWATCLHTLSQLNFLYANQRNGPVGHLSLYSLLTRNPPPHIQ